VLGTTTEFREEPAKLTPFLLLQTGTEVAHSVAASTTTVSSTETTTAAAAAEAVSVAVAIASAVRELAVHCVKCVLMLIADVWNQ
jgi:hypothetical protein